MGLVRMFGLATSGNKGWQGPLMHKLKKIDFNPTTLKISKKLAPKTWKRLRGREINSAQAYETEELDGTFSSTSQVRVAHCFPPGTHNTPTKRKKVAFFSANETRLNANTF